MYKLDLCSHISGTHRGSHAPCNVGLPWWEFLVGCGYILQPMGMRRANSKVLY